jgi:KH/beta-lactamase-domain protein
LTNGSLADIQGKIAAIVLEKIPTEAQVSRIEFEGPRVAVYTKRPEVLVEQSQIVTQIVSMIRKRIVIRSDPSVRADERESEHIIREAIPAEAELTNISFDPTIGEVIIEAKKPGLVIGKEGVALQEIIRATRWRPRVLRSPPIPSKTIANMRHYLHSESKDRERILRTIGERIFRIPVLPSDSVVMTMLGGFQEVGRSAMLVQTKESRILLDCGINPGANNPINAYPRLSSDAFNLSSLDAVIISHAHLDHCGFLPFLYKYGYDGPVYCSEPTASMMTLLQLDYLDVAGAQGTIAPYDQKHVRETVLHTIPIKEGTVTDISPDIRLTLHNAGHILGSTVVHLHMGEGLHNLVYTGDFKYGRTMLLEPAVSNFPRVETLIVESTYGASDDQMPARQDVEGSFISIVNSTLEKGGKVLIPVPAVGRAQEIMLVLNGYMRQKMLKEAPVYIEGMITEATAIHTAYPEYLAREVRDQIFRQGVNPFQSDYFVTVKDASVRGEILSGGPCIVMATSGMLEGGPAVEYFKQMAGDEKNTMIFVSYQIEGTMGRRLQRGMPEASLLEDGRVQLLPVRMRIGMIEGFSGHSDRRQILNYIHRISPKPERVLVNHGERSKCLSMTSAIHRDLGVETRAPEVLETMRLK